MTDDVLLVHVPEDAEVHVHPHRNGDIITEIGYEVETGRKVLIARTPLGADVAATKLATAVQSERIAAEADKIRTR